MHARAEAFRRIGERLEVEVRGQVDVAGRLQWAGEFLPSDRLKGIAGGAFDMAVIDHQRRAVGVHDASADLERNLVGAPFEDRADRSAAQLLRQHLVE
jgi:hypothetical protein